MAGRGRVKSRDITSLMHVIYYRKDAAPEQKDMCILSGTFKNTATN